MACTAFLPKDFVSEQQWMPLLSCLIEHGIILYVSSIHIQPVIFMPVVTLFLEDPKSQIQLHAAVMWYTISITYTSPDQKLSCSGRELWRQLCQLFLCASLVSVSSVLPWLPTSEPDIYSAAAGLVRHYWKISFRITLLTVLGIRWKTILHYTTCSSENLLSHTITPEYLGKMHFHPTMFKSFLLS